MPAITIAMIATFIVTLSGCDKAAISAGASNGASTVRSSTGQRQHAPTEAAPGSHDDWCGEHQVPESLCTRCNPSLAAAFKATGDWCPEHGLPESQCLPCNPGLKIERPQRAGGD